MSKDWNKYTIKDLISEEGIFVDGDWVESKDQDPEGDVRLIQLADVGDGKFLDKSNRYMTTSKAEELNCTFLEEGDILYSRLGEPLGKTTLFPKLDGQHVTVVDVAVIRPKNNAVNNKALVYLFNSPVFRSEVDRYKSGTTRKRISRKNLAKINFGFPNIELQNKIVEKLDSLFSRINAGEEGLKEVEKKLEVYRQAVLKGVFDGSFSRSLVQQNLLIPPIEEILYDSNDVPYNIPKNWRWVKFVDIGELGRGKSKHRPRNDKRLFGGKYPFIQTGEVRKSRKWLKKYSKTYSEFGLAQSKLWPKGTLLITIAANIADTAILEIDACFPDSVVGFVPKENICNVEYIEFFIRTIKDRLETFAPATAQKNINLRILNDVYIPLPPLDEQKMIVESVNKLMSISYVVEETIQKSRLISKNLKQSVLKKAFNGELI